MRRGEITADRTANKKTVGPIEVLVPTSIFDQVLGRRPAAKSLTRDEVLLCAELAGGAGHGSSGHVGLVPWGRSTKCQNSNVCSLRGSTELPECRCGSEMKIIKSDSIGSDAQVRTYQCPLCEHELRLTMWGTS